MKRQVKIRNILAFEEIDFEISEGATLITGANSSGKTSIARVLASLTAHEGNPAGLTVADLKCYLHGNQNEGLAQISDGATWNGSPQMTIPEGMERESLPHAVGLINFVTGANMAAKKRAGLFEELFLPENAEDILRPQWTLGEKQLLHVIKVINESGWDAAQELYNRQSVAAKQEWRKISGEPYGKKKAPEWTPEGWEPDLQGMSAQDMDAEVSEAEEVHNELVRQSAVAEHQIEEARVLRDKTLPPMKADLETRRENVVVKKEEADEKTEAHEKARKELQEAKDALGKKQNEIANLEKPDRPLPETRECPSCKKPLYLEKERGVLRVFVEENWKTEDNSEQIEKLKAELPKLESAVAEKQEAESSARAIAEEKTEDFRQYQADGIALRKQIEIHEAKVAQFADAKASEVSEAKRSQAEHKRDAAYTRRKAWQKNHEAQLAHKNVVEYELLVHLLSPAGARAEHMKAPMEELNEKLKGICAIGKWQQIRISDSYESYSGGRPTRLTAENEQKKVQWACQIAIAVMNAEAKWVILDAADLLRGASWKGLIDVVNFLVNKYTDKYVVVCATETEAPDGWAKIELGEG